MSVLLVWLTSNAWATPPIYVPGHGCPPYPCGGLLDIHFEIVPPDKLLQAQRDIAPMVLQWLEITVTTFRGEVELTVQDQYLDPRYGLIDERAGTVSWVVPVRDIMNVGVEVRNPNRNIPADYQVVAEVLIPTE